jgi:cell division protein FtsB
MARPDRPEAADVPAPDASDPRAPQRVAGVTPASAAALGSLSDLPVAGLTRRRIALLLGSLVAAWVILLFARQVGEASDAMTRASRMQAGNAAMQAEVAGLEAELTLIQRQAYIEQQARQYRLGEPHEIPFVLADDAPPLAADAPGTAAVRLGAVVDRPSPVESWLRLLFGPGGDPATPGSAPLGS